MNNKNNKTERPKDAKQWRCRECGSLLGFLDPTGTTIRIKYKDLYVTTEGGRVSVLCRRCGALNVQTDEEYEKYLLEKLKKNGIGSKANK